MYQCFQSRLKSSQEKATLVQNTVPPVHIRKTHQRSPVEIIESLKQLDDRRLAAARVSHESDLLPRRYGNGKVAQHLGLAATGIGESPILEFNVPLVF